MSDMHRRLWEVLEAYGASPDRWPEDERAALLALVDESSEARARLDAAARLDALLDAASEIPPPTDEAVARILDAAPRGAARKRSLRWLAALPVAAAAALALWVARVPEPAPRETLQIAMADLGVYETPTDVFLSIDGVDPLARVPGYGCDEDALRCLDLDGSSQAPDRHSSQGGGRRTTT